MGATKRIRTYAGVQERARELRKASTQAEEILWEAVRNRRLGGFKFRRQAPMGAFIVDFYCAERKLVIEIDGGVHLTQREADAMRTEIIQSFGYRVIRFSNEQVEAHLPCVLDTILAACQLPLLPGSGEGTRG